MSIFYIDLVSGSDAASGADWANAWKTISGGATAARIAPGDTIRISKTPDPVSIGNGQWTLNTQASGGFPATKSISAATNASPIEITTSAAHGYSTGDVIQVIGQMGNRAANGAWVITYVDATKFTLNDSVGSGTGSYSGTTQKINSKAIILETANTKVIDSCQIVWSNGVDGTASIATGEQKDASVSMFVTLDSSPNANSLQAYHATSALDLSAYQYISFWIRNSAAIADATTYTITLCSNADGTGVVDTFVIPAIPSTARWIPLTIARTGGGNLGSNIASIALNTGATTPTASSNIRFNNIIATKTNGINLQSLISKNGSAQGGTGAFYGIQSINGKVVLVDNNPNTVSNAGRGYYETSETCTTYIRETYKTALAASSATVVSELLDSGTLGNLISYEFGWTVNGTQDGETYLDGLNGQGYGIYASLKSYNSLNRIGYVRYRYSVYLSSALSNILSNISCCNCTASGIYNTLSFINTYNNIKCVNSTNYGIDLQSAGNSIFNSLTLLNCDYGGLNLFDASLNMFNSVQSVNSSYYGVSLDKNCSNNILKLLTTGLNASAYGAIGNIGNINYIKEASLADSLSVTGMAMGSNAQLWSIKEDGVEGNNWGYFYGSTYNWQTTTKYGTQPGAGKITITSSERNSAYKIPIKIAEIACEADKLVTVKAWVKKDHATNVACQIRVDTDAVTGVTGDTTVKADDTNWEELTLTFTPDFQSVCEIFFDSWYVSGNSNTYVGTISVTQAT